MSGDENSESVDLDSLIRLAKRKDVDISATSHKKKKKKPQSKEDNEYVYNYDTCLDDHCETPVEAYNDISAFLTQIAAELGKTSQELSIYDPYHCEGGVIERLASVGFPNVYNKNEDFYRMQFEGKVPEYDVLVTNPPYSHDHMERLLDFCVRSKKPWFILVPNYVYMKEYYARVTSPITNQIFYITPSNKRYLYTTPKGRRQNKSGTYTSPFPTFWFCYMQNMQQKIFTKLDVTKLKNFAKNHLSIPVEIAPDNDPRKKKIRNSQKRTKNKLRKKQGNVNSVVSNNNN